MSNNSDHTKNRTIIEKLLPEVYQSDINSSIFGTIFNRHLTPNDTVRVAGYIGRGNPNAKVKRQLPELTPHRQAYQLEPVMHTQAGTQHNTLSQHEFLAQLELMGVDIGRAQEWANTLQFNWIPPVNIDMFINYADYYWKPSVPGEAPQYFTIEGRCSKASAKVAAYDTLLSQYSSIIPIHKIQVSANAFIITGKFDTLLVKDFIFTTKNTTDVNLRNKRWTVNSVSYDATTGLTTVIVNELISIHSPTTPVGVTLIGKWWYNTLTGQLKKWSGTTWISASASVAVDISLTELRATYQAEADCACDGGVGWDIAPFDDNNTTAGVLWNDILIAEISAATEAEWITNNGTPVDNDIWYDLSNGYLWQYATGDWKLVDDQFDVTLAQSKGMFPWDSTEGCITQVPNQWSQQNHWIHKSAITSPEGIIRAQLPILEYGSTLEMNEWTEVVYRWKYRASIDAPFQYSDITPSRFEIEPIRKFITNISTEITIILEDSYTRDLDMSQVFVPGFRFRVVDLMGSATYTVKSAITVGTVEDGMRTQVTIQESTYTSALQGGVNESRIEPLLTSRGDSFRGYHEHWMLDLSASSYIPSAPVRENFLLKKSKDNPLYTSPDGMESWSHYHQQKTLLDSLPANSVIDLKPELKYVNPASVTQNTFALPGTELRVYVNDVRQYGNYIEITSIPTSMPVWIGNDSYNMNFNYVTAIQFSEPLNRYDVVRIEVAPAAHNDVGWSCIAVRTVENDAAFFDAISNYTQPAIMSIPRYIKQEQSKTQLNQSPLFNMYDIRGNIVSASPLFTYVEDSTYDINENIQRRIVFSADGRDYLFHQLLVDGDNGELYTYRDLYDVEQGNSPLFWYDSFTQQLKCLDSTAWALDYINPNTGVVFHPVISNTSPTLYYGSQDNGALWFNSTTRILYQYDGTQWVDTPVVIQGTDPLLQSIWQHGTNNEQYIPAYVDVDRQPVPLGSALGDWETFDQWFYNSEHHNYQTVKFTELLTHLRGIVNQQPAVPGLSGSGAYTLNQHQYNYGLGGTIKEHNDSFDTLISAVNVTNITPVGVIEFAENQYNSLMLMVRDIFNRSNLSLFADYSSASLINQGANISKIVIESYAMNDFATAVYGDTSAYDVSTNTGVKNWIITPPIMGLSPYYVPHMSVDNELIRVFHHDGHRSVVSYTPTEENNFAQRLCALPDPRISNGTLGKVMAATPPNTEAGFTSVFGGLHPRPGVYWYNTTGGTNKLYRFTVYAVSSTPPSIFSGGSELPDGVMYYNSANATTYQKQGIAWVPITVDGAGDISPLWTFCSLEYTLASVYLDIENGLYDISQVYYDLKFDYTSLTNDINGDYSNDAQVIYDQYAQQRFDAYVASHRIEAPLANVNYSSNDAFSWNYISSIPGILPCSGKVYTPFACWQALYNYWYGTPFPHLEPWTLQGYINKPTWWDGTYADITQTRRWISSMWTNIMQGIVPSGQLLPNGDVSTGGIAQVTVYNYIPVNSTSSTITGGYIPDALLPPYYATVSPTVRSLFNVLNGHVIGPSADYIYGDNGPVEWEWKTSTEFVYDKLVIAFLMQPVRFLQSAFGIDLIDINGLQVDGTTKRVYSHENVLFHGDVYDSNKVFVSTGINQWYVNYNRYSGYDTNTDFRNLWAGWEPRLSYQSASIIDTSTLEVFSKYMDVGPQDYQIVLANTGVIHDTWADSFRISVLGIPPAVIQYNNQNLWKFSFNTAAAVDRTLGGYGVQQYPVSVNVNTNTFSAFSFNIRSADSATRRFFVPGNYQHVFGAGTHITVIGTTHNDNTYEVITSVYEANSNVTRITVDQSIQSSGSGGVLELTGFILPWETGDMVFGFTTKMMPAPVRADTAYYVIRVGDRTFKLAETSSDAKQNISIDITIPGQGDISIGRVLSTFKVYGGSGNSSETWYHFELDRSVSYNLSPPLTVYGIQTIINMIDGYVAMAIDNKIVFNSSSSGEVDPFTGRTVTWQLEIERFIDFLFGLRNTRLNIEDKYTFIVDNILNNTLKFSGSAPTWTTGQPVMLSTTGTMPAPLFAGVIYYYVSDTANDTFTLSYSAVPTSTSIVNLTTTGSGNLHIARNTTQVAFPQFEMNPIRNNIWIDTPIGWLSDIIVGPYQDIKTTQTIFDQYGRPITPDKLLVYRQDAQSRIAIRAQLANDVEPYYTAIDDPYNYIHIGGCHLFTEGYEHVIMFNDYTTSGGLVYDSFVGLSTEKFEIDLRKSGTYTMRPTLGGFYLVDDEFNRNMEGVVNDLRNIYDTFTVPEQHRETKYARSLLGYWGDKEYYDLVNLNSKSQFLFYRGMIQTKGSTSSVKAYINSRRFVDAKIDEYWAWKIAEFGAFAPKIHPTLKLKSVDGGVPDVRVEFYSTENELTGVDTDHNFEPVSFNELYDERWSKMPLTRSDLQQSPLFLNASVMSMTRILATNSLTPSLPSSSYDIVVPLNPFVLKHKTHCDAVIVVQHKYGTGETDVRSYTTETMTSGVTIINSDIVSIDIDIENENTIFVVYFIGPSPETNSPGTLIDVKSNTTLSTVQYWDPARNIHSSAAIHNVDLQTDVNPAKYTNNLIPVDEQESNIAWNVTEVGTRWLDTYMLDYVPYYDTTIFPNIDKRLSVWGTLSGWADIRVCEWTESTVHPTQWNAQAKKEESNTLIPTEYRATGNVREFTYVRRREPSTIISITGADITVDTIPALLQVGDSVLINGDQMPTTAGGYTLEKGIPYYVLTITGQVITIVEDYGDITPITFSTQGSNLTMVRGFTADQWIMYPPLHERLYGVDYQSGPTLTLPVVDMEDGDVVDVYVNGTLLYPALTVVGSTISLVTGVQFMIYDIIDIVRPEYLPTTAELEFDPDIEDDGTIMTQWNRYAPYTTKSIVTDIGTMVPMYYFWTENGITRDITRNNPLSLSETKKQLITIPTPYYTVQKPVQVV